MQLIPVIDLKDGQVVHAVRGNRAEYKPIHAHSCLTNHSDIEAVLEGFLRLYAFKQFYIADLNAICGNGHHRQLIGPLLAAHPEIEFWVDNGCRLAEASSIAANYHCVIGTESQREPLHSVSQAFVLSLDFKGDTLEDPAGWFDASACWPETIIVMTLNRVGSGDGPDLDKLKVLKHAHPTKSFVAAGGIRHADDLMRLNQWGINGALLATALHDGNITRRDIESF